MCCSIITLPYDQAVMVSHHQKRRFSGTVANDHIHAARGKGAVPMGSAINRSFISAHFLLSAYFLTVQTFKCMRLITQVYGKLSVCTTTGNIIILGDLFSDTTLRKVRSSHCYTVIADEVTDCYNKKQLSTV